MHTNEIDVRNEEVLAELQVEAEAKGKAYVEALKEQVARQNASSVSR
jgi:hypothetical protein